DYGRQYGDLERDRQARRNFFRHGLARPHRNPEVEAKEAPYEVQELDDQRAIESELGVTKRDGARIDAHAAGAEAEHADVPWNKPHQHKHDRRRSDERRDQEQHPVYDIPVHPVRPILIAARCPSAAADEHRRAAAAYLSSHTLARS